MTKPISLVTGACGFMGTHMVEVLHEAGHEVRATDLPLAIQSDDRKTGRFPSVVRNLGVELGPADLENPASFAAMMEGVDYVFHIASVFNYTAPWEILHRINVEGCRALTAMAAKQKSLKRFVLWGAGGVYGLAEPWMLPLREDMAPNPPNNYLRSKWMQEFHLMELGRTTGFPFTIMRPTTVYGPRGVYGGATMIMGMAQAKVLGMPANFQDKIPFVHVRDVCQAALHLAQCEQAKGEVYNLSDDSQMTIMEFAQFMAEMAGAKFFKLPPVPVAPLKAVLIPLAEQVVKLWRRFGSGPSPLEPDLLEYLGWHFVYSNEKLKSTGYRFLYAQARDGIRDTVQWYRDNGWIK